MLGQLFILVSRIQTLDLLLVCFAVVILILSTEKKLLYVILIKGSHLQNQEIKICKSKSSTSGLTASYKNSYFPKLICYDFIFIYFNFTAETLNNLTTLIKPSPDSKRNKTLFSNHWSQFQPIALFETCRFIMYFHRVKSNMVSAKLSWHSHFHFLWILSPFIYHMFIIIFHGRFVLWKWILIMMDGFKLSSKYWGKSKVCFLSPLSIIFWIKYNLCSIKTSLISCSVKTSKHQFNLSFKKCCVSSLTFFLTVKSFFS